MAAIRAGIEGASYRRVSAAESGAVYQSYLRRPSQALHESAWSTRVTTIVLSRLDKFAMSTSGGHPPRSIPEVCFEPLDGAVYVRELVEAEESHPEGGEVVSFAAHERYAGRHLHATLLELRAAPDLRIIGEGHHDAGCGESFGRD